MTLEQPTNPVDREAVLLERACDAFLAHTGMRIEVDRHEVPYGGGLQADAVGRVCTYDVETPVVIEVKARPTKAAVGVIAQQLKMFPGQGLLVADYINPLMADRLKELDIWFVDTVGNAYIDVPPVLIFIKGNQRPEEFLKAPKARAFQPTGLKVVYVLLCDQDLVNAPYRDIAQAANVALGTVGWVMTDLRELGYLLEVGKRGRRLRNWKKLLNRWTTAYPERLRPKILIGKYTAADPYWWKNATLLNLNAYWGGEVAAERLTHYLKPENITLYVRDRGTQLQLQNKLRNDKDGKIELLEAFWNVKYDRQENEGVNPLLVYADLLATGDPRNIETAELIYEKEIARHIRED